MKMLKLTCLCWLQFACTLLPAQQYLSSTWGNLLNVSLVDTVTFLNIPVELKQGIAPAQLDITLLPVKADKLPSTTVITSFTSHSLTETAGKPSLVIAISNRPVVKPGLYVLEFRIRKKEPGTDSAIQSLSISLTVNAAEVKTIPATVISRTQPFFLSAYRVNGARIQIQEAGKKMPLDAVTIRTLKVYSPSSNELVPGIIRVTGGIPRTGPGGMVELDFDIEGALPLGKTIINAEVNAPQLIDPVPITIEVTSKKGIYLLLFVIMEGLAAGYFVRTLLEARIKLGTARLGALEFISVLDTEAGNRKDNLFLAEARKIKAGLKQVMQGSKDDAITSKTTDSRNDLTKAIDDHNNRRLQAAEKINNVSQLAAAMQQLPEHFSAIPGSIKSRLETALLVNGRGDAASAAVTIDEIQSGMDKTFGIALAAFRTQVQAGLDGFKSAVFTTADLKTRVDLIQSTLDQVDPGLPARAALPKLEKIFAINRHTRELVSASGSYVSNAAEFAIKTLQNLELKDAQAVTDLAAKTKSLVDKISDPALSHYFIFQSFSKDLDDFQAGFRKAIMAQSALPGETAQEKIVNDLERQLIESFIDDGQFNAAARGLEKFIKKHHVKGVAPVVNPVFAVPVFASTRPAEFLSLKPVITELETPPGVMEQYLEAEAEIRKARSWQSFLSGLVILLIGCGLYAETFTGTVTDIISVFMWGFLLDISVTTIMGGLGAKVAKK